MAITRRAQPSSPRDHWGHDRDGEAPHFRRVMLEERGWGSFPRPALRASGPCEPPVALVRRPMGGIGSP